MRRAAIALAVPALLLSVLAGSAAVAPAASGGSTVAEVTLHPPKCC